MAEGPAAQDDRVRVLVVEDDAATRVGLQQLLTSWGYAVESAVDGEDALAKVPDFRPDIVLTDLVMPRLDGLGLLRALQQEGADVTTVILTAQGTVETAVSAHQAGRLRLPHQAGRPAAPADPARPDRRAAGDAARSPGAASAAARRTARSGDDRRQSRDAGGLPDHRARGADRRVGAHQRRVGHRQGTGGPDAASPEPAGVGAVRADQLRGHSRHAARERAVRSRARRVHRRDRAAARLLRTGAPRHAVPRRDRRDDADRRRSSCCGCCRSGRSGASAAASSSRWTSASSRRPTSTRPTPSGAGSCARISSTG